MKKVAQFEKISMKQFIHDWVQEFGNRPDHIIAEIYNKIKLPERKTSYSAGHDFYMPYDFRIVPGGKIMIPTGIKCTMDNDYVMLIFPRSSLGIKKNMCISNTIPVVDADYINADNEGHIFISIENHGAETIFLYSGDAFAQAVFVQYGVADDGVTAERRGGIGSTGE